MQKDTSVLTTPSDSSHTRVSPDPPDLPNTPASRTVYLDYLRVFATFAVMILHLSAQKWYVADVNSLDWKTFNFFNSMVRWSVPVFVMISGALFLEKDIPVKKIFSKYVARLLIAFLFWSAVYACFEKGDTGDTLAHILTLLRGHYHMWFILMIGGLYISLPLLKAMIGRAERLKYYLLLAFLFAFVQPEMLNLAGNFAPETIKRLVQTLYANANDMNMHLVLGYTGYFILGYYLNKAKLNRAQRTVIYLLGVLGCAATILLSLIVSLRTQKGCGTYYNYLTVNVLLESLAVFTWFQYHPYRPKGRPLIVKLSKLSFGAYLVHALLIEQLDSRFGVNTQSFNAVLAILGIGLLVFLVSFALSLLCSLIPVVKKYAV